ncbi:hypothetical protein J0H58_28825 [bacterium]|nr:hypothetical protein [bacterium]
MPEPTPTNPAEAPTAEEDEFNYFLDWKEMVDATQPGGGDHVTAKEQEAVLVGLVPFNKVLGAEKWFLGHSWCDADTPYALHRQPPCRHPRRPTLYAFSFSSVGFVPKTHPPDLTDDTDPETGDQVVADPTGGTWKKSEYTGPDAAALYYSEYQYALCTVRFRSFGRMRFLPDAYIAAYPTPRYAYEWLRNTTVEAGPAVQALQAEGSSNLTFLEGAPPGAPPYGQAFPAPLAELTAKTSLSVRWEGVPHEYVSDNPYYLYPAKIIGLLGHINDADFIGNPKGTVLFLSAAFEPALQPLVPADPDEPLTAWDVTFTFEHYDPPKGVADSPPGTSPYRGHRVFPWRKTGLHYFAAREDGVSELLPLGPLYKIFQHINDPS